MAAAPAGFQLLYQCGGWVHNITAKRRQWLYLTPVQSVTVTNSGTGTIPTDVTFTHQDAFACTGQTGRIKNLKGGTKRGGNNYTFSLDGGAFTTSNQFTNVAPGTHTITARNDDGCLPLRRLLLPGAEHRLPATAGYRRGL